MTVNTNSPIWVSQLGMKYTEGAKAEALKEVSLAVNPGELFGLIGPDGAGKTTLFKILTTLLVPTSGQASVAGYNTVSQWQAIRRLVGYMPGRFSLYQDLSIEENLNFFARVFNTTVEENFELIKDIYVQIEPFKHRKAGKLSGGMKQKLALSCALIHKPQVLLLDEPTTGVDPVSRKEFWEMLRKLKAQGITIMVSTPYMDEAVLCDRIALIQAGRIMSVDTPASIVQQYPDVLYALESANNYALLTRLRQSEWVKSCYMFGEQLHVTSYLDRDQTWAMLEQQYPEVEKEVIAPNIEDCFIQLMQP